MIELNLLPPELRKRKSKKITLEEISKESIIYFTVNIVIGLIVIHFLLIGTAVIKGYRYKRLKKQWEAIQPEKKEVDFFKQEIASFEKQAKSIEGIMSKDRIIWSLELNRLSDIIPNGAWLRWVKFKNKRLTLEGSAVSRNGQEVILVNRFSTDLKKDNEFYKNFKDLDVSSIKRRGIKNIEVVDFIMDTYVK